MVTGSTSYHSSGPIHSTWRPSGRISMQSGPASGSSGYDKSPFVIGRSRSYSGELRAVHPRVGGETNDTPIDLGENEGPSLGVLGVGAGETSSMTLSTASADGSIPAWAGKPRAAPEGRAAERVHLLVGGKPRAAPEGRAAERVHPRVGGETLRESLLDGQPRHAAKADDCRVLLHLDAGDLGLLGGEVINDGAGALVRSARQCRSSQRVNTLGIVTAW